MKDKNIHLIKYEGKTFSFNSFKKSMKFVSTIYINLRIKNNTEAKKELKIFHAEIDKNNKDIFWKYFEKIDNIASDNNGFEIG